MPSLMLFASPSTPSMATFYNQTMDLWKEHLMGGNFFFIQMTDLCYIHLQSLTMNPGEHDRAGWCGVTTILVVRGMPLPEAHCGNALMSISGKSFSPGTSKHGLRIPASHRPDWRFC